MAGPVYRYSGKGALKLPDTFQGKLIHWDWSRSLMFATPVNADGTLDTAGLTPWASAVPNTFVSAGVAVPVGGPAAPIETVVGPDGALYVSEYGSGYYQNTNSAISRITCFQCTPSAADYAGAAVNPTVGALAQGSAPVPVRAPGAASELLAATGGSRGLAVLGGGVLLAAALLRRRGSRPADLSGL
jgi:hypothetical protein